MSKMASNGDPPANRLLAKLPVKNLKRILAAANNVELVFGEVIYEPGDVIGEVYFPTSGIISVLSTIDQRTMLEVGIVGREGMAGLPVFLGVSESANRAIVQGNGLALAIRAADFLEECGRNGALTDLMKRYTHSFLTQISRSAVCNRFHQVEARLARWLLMTHDRMETEEFQLTQEFLSHMLGVRREAVTLAAQNLQNDGLISYSRGKLKILDRKAVERTSCDCYSIIAGEEHRLFL